jgi:osmotically-inducible protein OsmY
MTILKKFSAVFAVCLLIFSTSCVETIVVGSAATGVLVMRQKNLTDTRHDIAIATVLGTEFIKNGLKNPGNSIDVTVNEGRVLLTGIARDPQKAKLASDLAWKVENVKEVIDEIQLSENNLRPRDFSRAMFDYGLTLEIETKLLLLREVASVNYKITTVNKVVYLIGVAAADEELQKVLTKISKVRGVEKIVNHVILSDDRRRNR